MKAQILNLVQGTPEWKAHRARSLNASELAIAMGISKNMLRNELLRAKATGVEFEHSDYVEEVIFANGHRLEDMARPWAEAIIGDILYSGTFNGISDCGLNLSASLDGHTLMNEVTWEHKQMNKELAESLAEGIIPEQYHPQMEQGLMLSGAEKCLFMASNGDKETMKYAWYESNPALRAKILPTWHQFLEDARSYVVKDEVPKAVGVAPETLPALTITLKGEVTTSNLAEFKTVALKAIQSVNRDLKNDQDFADAEKAVKWCTEVESRIGAAKDHALGQTQTIDELFKAMEEIREEARAVRLELTKLVDSKKKSIKEGIVIEARTKLGAYVNNLNDTIASSYLPFQMPDFNAVIKGLRSIDSMQNAVDTEVARAKIEAQDVANRIHKNLQKIKESELSLTDVHQLVLKETDDLVAILAVRTFEEKTKIDALREKVAQEERERIEREALEKAAAEVRSSVLPDGPSTVSHTSGTVTSIASRVAMGQRPVFDDGKRMKLGDINARLAPIALTVDGLAQLGFTHVATDKSAKLYRASDFTAICAALVDHIKKSAVVYANERLTDKINEEHNSGLDGDPEAQTADEAA